MYSLKFDSFNLPVTDFVLDGSLFAIDSKFSSKEEFDNFYLFSDKHYNNETALDYSLDGISYHGHFGRIVYDINYNTRFYMSTSPDKYNFSPAISPAQYNLPRLINSYEKRIALLTNLLSEKGILTKDESKAFSCYLPYGDGHQIDFQHQVENLNEYLTYTEDTLDDIRKRLKEDESDIF